MQMIYYDWESQKIVYYFEHDMLDSEFSIPGLRCAYYNGPEFDANISSFSYNWSVNSIVKNLSPISNDLFTRLRLSSMKCACIHDIIRICNVMKMRMKHDAIQFVSDDIDVAINNSNIETQYKEYVKKHMNPILAATSYLEVKEFYRDFWIATKYVDDLVDVKINKFL